MTIAFIGVGSNIGDRKGYIEMARKRLESKGIQVVRVSPLYESKALCPPDETIPDFLNGVFEIETSLSPSTLLDRLEAIEREFGREEKGNKKARTLDLDILFYGGEIVETKRLKIPHPEIPNRWFVLRPLVDLKPGLVHPIFKKSAKDMLQETDSPL